MIDPRQRPPQEPLGLPIERAPESVWRDIEAQLDSPPRRSRPAPWWRWAAAALLVIACGVGFVSLRDRGWASGDWLETAADDHPSITLGSIGSMEVEPNTRVRLLHQSPDEMRLELAHGGIDVNVTAPPRLFFVETPSATAVDLGCAYKLHTDEAGNGLLEVTSGWVSLEREGHESLVPAGASCRTRAGGGPGTPFFSDASPAFRAALDAFDRGSGGIGTILAESRPRDTLTLWHLVPLVEGDVRERLVDRAIALVPLPTGVTRERILSLDADTLTRWREELAWSW